MKKAIFIFPLLGMIIFIGIWWSHHTEHEKRKQDKVVQARQELEERRKQEARDRDVAIKDALKAQEERRKERAEKEAQEKAKQEVRQQAIERRDRTASERQRFSNQADQLAESIRKEKEAVAALEEDKRKASADLERLREIVRQVQSNERNLLGVIDRITQAEAARAAAAAAAAASRR